MSAAAKWILGIFILFLVTGISFGLSVMGTFNSFVSMEKNVVSQYQQNQNNYDSMFKKFKESAQVSEMYASDVERVYKSAIEGRYGENGSQAVFQFLKEQNPNMDASLYKRIQKF
jgi:AICAR transformylase/IMP cyclohydrolase PurH